MTLLSPAEAGYDVHIRRNADGEVRKVHMDDAWVEGMIYWWTDGNFGCDCNRELCFRRAGGEDPTLADVACGDGEYTVLGAELPNGKCVPLDGLHKCS